MRRQKFLDKVTNLIREKMLLKFIVVSLSVAVVVSSIASYKALKYTRTIITPCGSNQSYGVNDYDMDDEGVKQFTRRAIYLSFNYTPKSAKKRFDELLSMFHTRYYSAGKKDLDKKLETIKRMNVVSTFIDESILHNKDAKKIKVTGIHRKSTYGKEMYSEVEEWTLSYDIVDANFKMIKMERS